MHFPTSEFLKARRSSPPIWGKRAHAAAWVRNGGEAELKGHKHVDKIGIWASVPSGPDWLHEVKYDGYRLRVERDGDRVRLITRGGYDWSKRYPWIVESALKNRYKQFVVDGEAVLLGVRPHLPG